MPPVVEKLELLAAGDTAIAEWCASAGVDPNREFELRVGAALSIMGFDVEPLGQGAGRVADGVARWRSESAALIFDAKVRSGGFVFGTEDRKFREYIETHGRELEAEGVRRLSFAVISSRFADGSTEKAKELVRTTRARTCVLLEAGALVALVDARLRRPKLAWRLVQPLLSETAILNADDVEKLVRELS